MVIESDGVEEMGLRVVSTSMLRVVSSVVETVVLKKGVNDYDYWTMWEIIYNSSHTWLSWLY